MEGRGLHVCATSPAAASRWLSDRTLAGFAKRMREHPRMHADRIAQLVEGFPLYEGQWGPQANLAMSGGNAAIAEPIEHGLALRLRIPFPKATRLDLWMNGEPELPSPADGYTLWRARAFTCVQINIPPARSRSEDLFVVTCRYEPGEKRVTGQPW
jgi:hypothetical protein